MNYMIVGSSPVIMFLLTELILSVQLNGKKMSAFYALMNDLNEHLKIKDGILRKKRTEKKFVVTILKN